MLNSDGIDTNSEEWRHRCEVNYVLNMKNNRERVAYVNGVAEKRGQAAADRLRHDVRELLKVAA